MDFLVLLLYVSNSSENVKLLSNKKPKTKTKLQEQTVFHLVGMLLTLFICEPIPDPLSPCYTPFSESLRAPSHLQHKDPLLVFSSVYMLLVSREAVSLFRVPSQVLPIMGPKHC